MSSASPKPTGKELSGRARAWVVFAFALTALGLGALRGRNSHATSQIIRVNGSLFDNSGNPVNGGSHTIVVNAFAAATGGTSLWTSSTYSGVAPNLGAFTVDMDASLGGVTSLTAKVMQTTSSSPLWFEMTVDGNKVRPRMRARGTAFALSAQTTDGLRGYPVSALAPVSGNVLLYSGSSWGPSTVNADTINALSRTGDSMSGTLNIGSTLTSAQTVTAATLNVKNLSPTSLVFTNAAKVLTSATAAVSDAQLVYLANVTANIQTQLNSALTSVTTGVLSVAAPLTLSSSVSVIGATVNITVATAGSSSSGAMLASDWNTFNNAAQNLLSKVISAGDTMTGPLNVPTLAAASAYVTSLTPWQLVRADANSNLTSVTTVVTDAQLAYLTNVRGGIEGQLSQKLTVAGPSQPPGTIFPFAGGRHGSATSGSATVSGFVGTTTLAAGQQIVASTSILPPGTTIASIAGPNSVTLSNSALSSVSTALFIIPPTGYLLCDGSAVSRATYANLFAVIGTNWGSGDGATTFNLPDLRGRFLRGQNMGSGIDPEAAARGASASGGNSGDAVGSNQSSQYASHFHLLNDPGHIHTLTDPGHGHGVGDPGHSHYYTTPGYEGAYTYGSFGAVIGATGAYMGAAGTGLSTYAATTGITLSSVTTGITLGTTGGNETRPTNSDVNYVIKY